MPEPGAGPFLFDASAERWLTQPRSPEARLWWRAYQFTHVVHVSAITVLERLKGYALLSRRALDAERHASIAAARTAYLRTLGHVWPVDTPVARVAAELMALLPHPPSPAKQSHREAESRAERLARWRFDIVIAATALLARLPLIHNNAADFETIRRSIEMHPELFPGLGPLQLWCCAALD